jgi:glycosyltransferase involved in cell wall biosynthesis
VKICLVTAFPPSRGGLNEYGYHVAQALAAFPGVSLTILADKLKDPKPEVSSFDIIRCWSFGSLMNPLHLLRVLSRLKPDVVWFNIGFASFGSRPLSAFLGVTMPALVRLRGFYTHVTLHQIMDTMNLQDARVPYPNLYRVGGWMATRLLLMANSISVLIPAYRRALIEKYGGGNVHFRPHGILFGRPEFPDLSRRGNPHRILAFGKWGTYKRLEPLLEAFEKVAAQDKSVRLVVAGGNHPETPNYVESIAQKVNGHPQIEFLGYVPEQKVSEIFRCASVVVLPYSSSAGSSGVAHLACEYGVPIVAADLAEFRDMANAEGLAICFYEPGNTQRMADALTGLLTHPEWQQQMAERNFGAALRMTMPKVIQRYLRLFELDHHFQTLKPVFRARRLPRWLPYRSLWSSVFAHNVSALKQYWPSE